jgi:ribosomal protein L31E
MKQNEAEYIIPLRKEVMKVPKYDRTKKSVIAVREFLIKHTKSKNVLLGKELNKKLQEHGRKNVPPRIHVKVIKDEEKYKAELIGFPIELEKDKKTKEDKKKTKEAPKEEPKETDKEKAEETIKKETLEKTLKDKKEIKTIPKDQPKKEISEKSRHQEIVTKTEKPKHEKKK